MTSQTVTWEELDGMRAATMAREIRAQRGDEEFLHESSLRSLLTWLDKASEGPAAKAGIKAISLATRFRMEHSAAGSLVSLCVYDTRRGHQRGQRDTIQSFELRRVCSLRKRSGGGVAMVRRLLTELKRDTANATVVVDEVACVRKLWHWYVDQLGFTSVKQYGGGVIALTYNLSRAGRKLPKRRGELKRLA